MKLENINRVMAGILVVFLIFCIANWVQASEKHRPQPPMVIEITEVINKTFNTYCSGSALSGAAGQHQYKTSDKVQWSAAAAYQSGACDTSALSVGFAWRAFERPITVSLSSDGKEGLVTIQTGGEF